MDIYESQRKSVIMIWNSTFLRITKSNCNELWFTMTVCRHNNFFHITDSEILLLSVWMQKYINLFKDSILWLIIVLSFSLDRLESSVTNSHFFHWWSLKSCVEVEQCVIIYIFIIITVTWSKRSDHVKLQGADHHIKRAASSLMIRTW